MEEKSPMRAKVVEEECQPTLCRLPLRLARQISLLKNRRDFDQEVNAGIAFRQRGIRRRTGAKKFFVKGGDRIKPAAGSATRTLLRVIS